MSADTIAPLIALIGLLLASGFFSGSETALFSLKHEELQTIAMRQDRISRSIAIMMQASPRLLLTILISNNLINICYFALAAWWGHHLDREAAVAIGALTALICGGEILPKVIASGSPQPAARFCALPLRAAMITLTPIAFIVERMMGKLLDASAGIPEDGIVTDDELKLVIEESHKHGVVSELVHDRMLEIIDLSQTPVYKVMTHRTNCVTVANTASMDDIVQTLKEQPSPYVVIFDSDQNEACVGILTASDVLRGGKLSKRMRKPLFIPAGALLPAAIRLFQDTNQTVGVVVDEYGSTDGILTLAHIGNELLGSGSSEDLPDIAQPQQIDERTWRISGLTPLESWGSIIDLETDTARECTTVGGFITASLGSIPMLGDQLLYGNLLFRVESVQHHRIESLIVQQLSRHDVRRMTNDLGKTIVGEPRG